MPDSVASALIHTEDVWNFGFSSVGFFPLHFHSTLGCCAALALKAAQLCPEHLRIASPLAALAQQPLSVVLFVCLSCSVVFALKAA